MATCNDCFHQYLCVAKTAQLRRHGITVNDDITKAEKQCICYLDRSRVTVAPKTTNKEDDP